MVVHIGYPKTATTTLQVKLFPCLNACDFVGKHPYKDQKLDINWLSIFRDVMHSEEDYFENNLEKNRSIVRRRLEASDKDIVIFSHEGFLRQNRVFIDKKYMLPEIGRRLNRVFCQFDDQQVKVIFLITLRCQKDIMPSTFIQHEGVEGEKSKYGSYFGDYLDYCFNNEFGYGDLFDYTKTFNSLNLNIRKSSIVMLPMEGIMSGGVNPVKQILAEVLSTDQHIIDFLLFGNALNQRVSTVENVQMYRFRKKNSIAVRLYRGVSRYIDVSSVKHWLQKSDFLGIYSAVDNAQNFVPEQLDIEMIKRRYAESNKKLADILGVDLAHYGYF